MWVWLLLFVLLLPKTVAQGQVPRNEIRAEHEDVPHRQLQLNDNDDDMPCRLVMTLALASTDDSCPHDYFSTNNHNPNDHPGRVLDELALHLYQQSQSSLRNNVAGILLPPSNNNNKNSANKIDVQWIPTTTTKLTTTNKFNNPWCPTLTLEECQQFYGQNTCLKLCIPCTSSAAMARQRHRHRQLRLGLTTTKSTSDENEYYISNTDQEQTCAHLQDYINKMTREQVRAHECLQGATLTGCEMEFLENPSTFSG